MQSGRCKRRKEFRQPLNLDKGERKETRARLTERVHEEMNKYQQAVDKFSFRIFSKNRADLLMKRADWVVRMRQGTYGKTGPENTNRVAKFVNWVATGSTQRRVGSVDTGLENIAGFLGNT